jgi:dTDP-4-dehydrorhamnose 3,5-epimerase
MQFQPTKLRGVVVVEPTPSADERGFFARTWCRETFAAHGLSAELSQCSVSFNHRKGTLRGLHYQAAPFEEAKLVRCTHGAIFDVAVDVRAGSPTFGEWVGLELSARNRRMLFVPEGVAHGFMTLEDDSEVFYQISKPYRPEAARGIRWDDPTLAIAWPLAPTVVSERDAAFAAFDAVEAVPAASTREVVFWGGTGQAKVLRELLPAHGLSLAAVVDNNAALAPPFADVPLLAGHEGLAAWLADRPGTAPLGVAVAIGGDRGRDRVALQASLEALGLSPLTLIHPSAFVAPDAELGAGCQILAQAAVCVEARLGKGCIVNTGATVDHECRLGDGVHVAPGAHLAGQVTVGDFAMIGTGAAVLPRLRIGAHAVVGAGAVVTRDVPDHAVVCGNPARQHRPTAPSNGGTHDPR